MRSGRLLLVLGALLLAGCVGPTLRIEVAPTLDTAARPGFEATFSAGLGLPLDLKGRSSQYAQVLWTGGGGLLGGATAGMVTYGAGADYLYWLRPRFDLRAGGRFTYRNVFEHDPSKFYGVGAHAAFLPLLWLSGVDQLATQLCIGPELRFEYVWGNDGSGKRGIFSLPFDLEINYLTVGD